MSSVPAYADPLAFLPGRHAQPNSIDHTGDLMARDARIVQPWPVPFLHKDVTVTDAASLYLDANGIRTRFWHLTIHSLKRAARTTDLHRSHL
jgi:hypothetical protein